MKTAAPKMADETTRLERAAKQLEEARNVLCSAANGFDRHKDRAMAQYMRSTVASIETLQREMLILDGIVRSAVAAAIAAERANDRPLKMALEELTSTRERMETAALNHSLRIAEEVAAERERCKARALEVVGWQRNDYNGAQIDPLLAELRNAM